PEWSAGCEYENSDGKYFVQWRIKVDGEILDAVPHEGDMAWWWGDRWITLEVTAAGEGSGDEYSHFNPHVELKFTDGYEVVGLTASEYCGE
ncbi:MAG: hypothetical protein VW683_14615, partial [Betaproteobacteria bacterium]